MSRLLLTGLMAASVFVMGCQQQKIGSEPQPAAQPRTSANPPPTNVPPRGPGPGPGTVNNPPPPAGPGPGPGVIVRPPPVTPPPPGYGPGPGAGNTTPPPPGYGPGPGPGTYNPPPPPPNNGPGPGYGPGPGAGTSNPPIRPTEPPIYNPPVTPPPTNTPTGYPPTTNNPPPQQPPPPAVQPTPVVPSVNLPPQNYPQEPSCIGANCGNQQVIPPPAPPQQQPPVVQQPPPAPWVPAQKPMVSPQEPGPAVTIDRPVPAPSIEQPPVVQQPPVVEQLPPAPIDPGPKPECRDIPLNMELSTTKLDVLMVVDTSASMREGKRKGMNGELGQVAKQMASFVRNLDPKTKYRIGVMLGHGPDNSKHPSYKHGTLFQVNSSDPAVIDLEKMEAACGKGKNVRECAIKKVVQALEKKMHSLPTDHSDAQGEALMLSLYDIAANQDLRLKAKKQGMFRSDAVLSIIPISDEQDVCYDYSTCTKNEGESDDAFQKRCTPAQVKLRDRKGKLIGTTGQDPHEVNFYNDVCKRAVNNTPLTPSNVLNALTDLKEGDIRKVAITPIVYLDNSTPVRAQDENEMGHGYIELAQYAKGMVADLNTAHAAANGESNFETILKFFGQFIDSKMKIQPPFACASDVYPTAVDTDSVDVHILDQNGNDLQLFSPECTGEDCAGKVQSTINYDTNGKPTHIIVDLNSVELYKALQKKGFKKGQVRMKFKTRSDVDAKTGARKRPLFRPKRKVKKAPKHSEATQMPTQDFAI